MSCEACSIKFSLFKRKKQCMDCLRYFCTECVIRRFDRILSCDNCSMLSRRPLIRSQILQMRSKYLRQYLLAKKVSLRGCIEKEDLVNLLIIFANGTDVIRNNDRIGNTPQTQANENRRNTHENRTGFHEYRAESNDGQSNRPEVLETNENTSVRRSRSPQNNERTVGHVTTPEEVQEPVASRVDHHVEIEEVSEEDDIEIQVSENHETDGNQGPEPVITEHDEVLEVPNTEGIQESSRMCSEIQTWTGTVKLSDIKELSDLENLSPKQLKDLLSMNRVDFKGCVERCELLDRACRLWEEYKKSRTVIETADEDALCKICLDAPIECVILECGHMACCINCGKQMSECPICRQYVVRVVRFFKA
ncbi:E3 ubiquitin-protein ligase RNF34 isoform X2 [Copidosoma floridanum]|uniref:E3 ubiquitin-protein ligase RNF34 isoform X2 n=1 Tax=Copidosoma floridanum TaxID=29053 RepID=UPI0006C99262|nr:E3 ubiquitin-protein ligase RNF34 isoform X2 [Copidosoma floridanum]